MTSIFTRSALVFLGKDPAPNVAGLIRDHSGEHVITWSEVLANRRERQRRILECKRRVQPWRAAKVWIAYFDQFLFGGWQAFIQTIHDSHWIDRDRRSLIATLLSLFPFVQDDGDERNWEKWKPGFARHFRRRTHHRRPCGVSYVWWDGHDKLAMRHPATDSPA